MTDLTVRDLVISFLQKDYKLRSEISVNLTSHLDRLYDNYIISTDDRKRGQKNVSEVVNNLNKQYNNTMIKMRDDMELEDFEGSDDSESNKIINKSLESFVPVKLTSIEPIIESLDVLRTYKLNIYEGINLINFRNIDTQLKSIVEEMGAGRLSDVLSLYISCNYLSLIDKTHHELLKFLEKSFIPVSVEFTDKKTHVETLVRDTSSNEQKKLDGIKCRNVKFEAVENKTEKYEMLLENLYMLSLETTMPNMTLEITGYLELDPINSIVRTCQICREFIYDKKKRIFDAIEKIGHINKSFKSVYTKNLTVGDLLCYDEDTIKNKLSSDYQKYIKYTNTGFKHIMTEFLQVDFKTKFTMIKFLLMGTTSSINVAGLLFGLTKDYKDAKDSKSKPTLISDIIYKNLNYPAQNKLRKSNVLISQELERLKSLSFEDVDMKKQIIANKNMPQHIKKLALDKLEEMKSGSSEYYKQMQYVKILIDYPWVSDEDEDIFTSMNGDLDKCKSFLDDARKRMDDTVYGHNECKNAIIELLGKWFTNPKSLGKSIGLVGPPGVGKTLFAKALGAVLGIPFTQVNLGGVEDGSVLAGHSFTYSGAQPGLIVRKMIEAGSSRSIMFFDELDKASTKHGVNEVFNILMHVTDSNTNANFNDKFFQEVTFPLNKVLFIFSFNDADKIDKILLDRMELIDVSAYDTSDKIKIVKDYMLKEITTGVGIDNESIKIADDDISHVIEAFTFEAGVRELKRKLESILLKMNLDRIYGRDPFNADRKFSKDSPIFITKDLIEKYLKKPKLSIKKIHSTDEVGVINGLYATTNGSGGIIPILVYKNHASQDRFTLKLTGSQGKVMKESIHFAFTIAMNLVKDKFIANFIDEHTSGLHIHTPDGATPKDGPSAGAAFTTAFISRILGKKIKNTIAMTGEIEINGRITAIGGLEFKLMGAKKAGVKLVFVPKENEDDYNKIINKNKNLVDDNFKIIIVDHITELLDYALVDDKFVSKLKKPTGYDYVFDKTFSWSDYLTSSTQNQSESEKVLDKEIKPNTKRQQKKTPKKLLPDSESNSDSGSE